MPAASMPAAAPEPVRPSVSHLPAWCNRASLVPSSHHNPALLRLFRHSVSNDMVIYVAQQLMRIIPVNDDTPQLGTTALPTPPHTPHKTGFGEQAREPDLMPLEHFIWHVIHSANVPVPIVLATLVYLRRLHNKLPRMAKGIPCTRHRVFLATLIVAAKYLNDACPKNKFWAEHAPIFHVNEINLMETQLLFLLDYDLRFDENEACAHFAPFMRAAAPHATATRQKAVSRVAQAGKARAAQAQMPPTPPSDPAPAPPQAVAGTVHNIAKRITSVVLTTTACEDRRETTDSVMYTTEGTESSDTGSSSVSSSETEETGETRCSSTGSSSSDGEGEGEGEAAPLIPETKFVLRPVPTSAYRRRKGSDATLTMAAARGSSTSLNTIGSDGTAHTQWTDTSRTASPAMEKMKVTPSRTMPVLPAGASGFLSRMWGVATKGTPTHSGHGKTPVVPASVVDIAEPQEALLTGQVHATGAFHLRRLAHSRSAMFRGGPVDAGA